MPGPRGASFPLEALVEGVARAGPDGSLEPCNDAMRRVLAAWTPGERELARLRAGEPFVADAVAHELSSVEHGGERWWIARPVAGEERAITAELAAARVRMLGDLASSIAHDLANLLGSAMGLASLLEVRADESERELCAELQRGVARGAQMVRTLTRMLARSPRERAQVAVGELIDGACVLAGRMASMLRVNLAVEVPPELPPIRVVTAESQQALVLGLVALLDTAPANLVIAATVERAAIAGGRDRRCVRVRVTASGCRRAAGHDAAPEDWRTTAALALRIAGGDFAAAADGDPGILDYVWPAD